jgi:hypothetical protein
MRFFVHATAAVDEMIRAQGLERRFYRTAGPWQVIVYARTQPCQGEWEEFG